MAGFLDTDFPRDVAAGIVKGLERRTNVASLGSGREERNARWSDSRRSWQGGLGIRTADGLAAVVDLFEECNGRLYAFRFRDWTDYKSCLPSGEPGATDQVIGTGDGAALAFPLVKKYGSLNPYLRDITKPVSGSVLVAVDGVPVGSGWTVDHLTGVVTFTVAPINGAAITAGFKFDVPVRFDSDTLGVDAAYFTETVEGVGSMPEVPLIEVRENHSVVFA